MDVSAVRPRRHRPRLHSPVVVARPPCPARRGLDAARLAPVDSSKPAHPQGRGCRHALSRPDEGLSPTAVDCQGLGQRSDGLASVAADVHVLWRRRCRHRHPALRHGHHFSNQSQPDRDPAELAVRTHLDCALDSPSEPRTVGWARRLTCDQTPRWTSSPFSWSLHSPIGSIGTEHSSSACLSAYRLPGCW